MPEVKQIATEAKTVVLEFGEAIEQDLGSYFLEEGLGVFSSYRGNSLFSLPGRSMQG